MLTKMKNIISSYLPGQSSPWRIRDRIFFAGATLLLSTLQSHNVMLIILYMNALLSIGANINVGSRSYDDIRTF